MLRFSFILFFLFCINQLHAQINSKGYAQFKWAENKINISNLKNCNNKQSGQDFENCELISQDSLFLLKFKYKFVNLRFYKSQLSEIQFDLYHKDIANIISQLTLDFGSPIIKEKRQVSIEGEEPTIGYVWDIGDTHVLIINDGKLSPSICILSSNKINKTYPINSLSLEKLIFE